METTTNQQDYRVNLEVFEGPLDLLLYLIKKNDLDIYDIPVAFMLEKYIGYLETLKEMNIDLAGDFLLMAAELTHIKSKMLLPGGEEEGEDEDEDVDPRADLVRRLLEYQRYKEASESLLKRSMVGRDVFIRGDRDEPVDDADKPLEGNVFDLVNAFSTLLRKVPAMEAHEVMVDRISVNDRILQIVEAMRTDATVALHEILPDPYTRYDLVITFLSLLEMARLRMIKVYQGGVEDTIRVRCTMESVDENDVMRLFQDERSTVQGGEPDQEG